MRGTKQRPPSILAHLEVYGDAVHVVVHPLSHLSENSAHESTDHEDWAEKPNLAVCRCECARGTGWRRLSRRTEGEGRGHINCPK